MYTMGTREYMAPEAWQGIIAPSGDIHCLGVMLYKMLTGRYPYLYEGSDPQGVSRLLARQSLLRNRL